MNRKSDYKDLQKYANSVKRYKQGWRKRTGAFAYPKRRWTPEEDKMILAQNIPDRQLSREIERSVGAIQKRRNRLREIIRDGKG